MITLQSLPLKYPIMKMRKMRIVNAIMINVIRLLEPSMIGMGPMSMRAPPEPLNLPALRSKMTEISANASPTMTSESPRTAKYCWVMI